MRWPGAHREQGQAAVELVALVPLIALLAVGGVQFVATLNAWSAAHESARAGARAELVGVPARDAARRAAVGVRPRDLRVQSTTTADGTRRVRVQSVVPRLLPWVPVPTATAHADASP